MGEGRWRDDERGPAEPAAAVPALVEAQLEEARERVFRAYVRARAQARDLAFDDQLPRDERESRP